MKMNGTKREITPGASVGKYEFSYCDRMSLKEKQPEVKEFSFLRKRGINQNNSKKY